MWQALRDELLEPNGIELVTVGMETQGAEACRAFIEAAAPKHPSLIDEHHVLASLFGVINIPSSVWIDERGMIVRPAEPAPAPPKHSRAADGAAPRSNAPRAAESKGPATKVDERFAAMMAEVGKMTRSTEAYHEAIRDWAQKGDASVFSLAPDQVIARSQPRDADVARGHAHFEMASHLEQQGHHDAAIEHFRQAHRLVPDSWTFRRQAWTLEGGIEGPLARFWQGPAPDGKEAWPYEGDWLTDVRRVGPENYNPDFEP